MTRAPGRARTESDYPEDARGGGTSLCVRGANTPIGPVESKDGPKKNPRCLQTSRCQFLAYPCGPAQPRTQTAWAGSAQHLLRAGQLLLTWERGMARLSSGDPELQREVGVSEKWGYLLASPPQCKGRALLATWGSYHDLSSFPPALGKSPSAHVGFSLYFSGFL